MPFDPNTRQCGLLLDEWTEVIPGKEETTGITFHYDRPNSEPPQVLLLAVSPALKGGWQWNDLIDTLREVMVVTGQQIPIVQPKAKPAVKPTVQPVKNDKPRQTARPAG